MFARFTPSLLCCLAASAALLWAGAGPAAAQELRAQPVPFSVWLDFAILTRPDPPRVSLPIWLESLQVQHNSAKVDAPEQTIYRLRLRRLGQLNQLLQVRLLFNDDPEASPVITGWTETGTQRYRSEILGNGLNLPTSVALAVPVEGTDYLDVTVPGNGSNLRGVFLSTLAKIQGIAALDFPPTGEIPDPFGNLPAIEPQADDSHLYGRVRATLEAKAVKLDPDETLDFELDRQPLMALVTFEALNVDISYPPEMTVNSRPLGPVTMHLPDLADPAYRGDVRPLERDMRFRYTGWLRCQTIVPGSALRTGLNSVILRINRQGGSIAVRAVEIQLKHNWQNFDYTVSP